MSRLVYTLMLWLLLPYALLHLLWRGRRQPGYRQHVRERFGLYAFRPERPVIWLHAVSVGETRAAAPLVKLLRERHPHHDILLTHMTPTGRETAADLYGEGVTSCYLPYDYPFAVRRFLRHFRPRVGIIMETEIWFNLVREAARARVPLLLVNGRMSEKSRRGYARFAALTRESLQLLAAVAAQTEADAARLRDLGAPAVQVLGNLKFDFVPPAQQLARGGELRALFGAGRKVLLAASTRQGEEALLLDALAEAGADWLTVIVPRHPQRFDEVATLIGNRGWTAQRRSAHEFVRPETRIVLGDSMGEMFAYYAACDVAFIGGSLLPLGGQNLIEACAVGRPVLIGPHTFNFANATCQAIEAGAALRVESAADLVAQAARLLDAPGLREQMGRTGLAFCARHRGAAERTADLVGRWMNGEQ